MRTFSFFDLMKMTKQLIVLNILLWLRFGISRAQPKRSQRNEHSLSFFFFIFFRQHVLHKINLLTYAKISRTYRASLLYSDSPMVYKYKCLLSVRNRTSMPSLCISETNRHKSTFARLRENKHGNTNWLSFSLSPSLYMYPKWSHRYARDATMSNPRPITVHNYGIGHAGVTRVSLAWFFLATNLPAGCLIWKVV